MVSEPGSRKIGWQGLRFFDFLWWTDLAQADREGTSLGFTAFIVAGTKR